MAADVFVAGVGMIKFGRYPDKDVPRARRRGGAPGARRRGAHHRATSS